jgi:hypothetical protein
MVFTYDGLRQGRTNRAERRATADDTALRAGVTDLT